MQYHKYIVALVLTVLLNFSLAPPVAAEKATDPVNNNPKVNQEETPAYLKNIIVISIDDWNQKYFQQGTMPRLVGFSQEGLRGKVLDYPGKAYLGKQQQKRLIGDIPDLYRTSQRLSMLVDAKDIQSTVDGKFNYIFSPDNTDRDNPDKIIRTVTDNFSKLNPYFTLVTLTSPRGTEQEKTTYFRKLDTAVGGLLAMLHEKGIYDNTMLVILGKNSDQSTKADPLPEQKPPVYPLIMKGPNLVTGTTLPPVNLEDIQATIFYLSDGKELKSVGHIIWNSLKQENMYLSQNLLNRRIREITEERDYYVSEVWQAEKEQERFEGQRRALAKEREGINNKLAAKEKQVKLLASRVLYYKIAGVAILTILILGYGVEYVILRKRFLLF